MIKDEVIRIRVNKYEKEKYVKLVNKKGIKLSHYIRELLDRELLKENS